MDQQDRSRLRERSPRRRAAPNRNTDRYGIASIEGARPAAVPDRLEPQLATTADKAPEGDAWLHEIKLDGYRLIARRDGGKIALLTRKGLDWSAKFPFIAQAIGALGVESAVIDGEACHVRDDGTTSFGGLQDDLSRGKTDRIFYFGFDVLYLDGWDLTDVALETRKALLEQLLEAAPTPLLYCEHVEGDGAAFRAQACQMQLEGIVSKRRDSRYRPGRSDAWRKVKCLNREEFIVLGWTDPEGSRIGFGSLLLGYYTPAGELRFAGRVGTGFSDRLLAELAKRLAKLARNTMPLARLPATSTRYGFGKPFKWSAAHWVEPELVAEVNYLTWTGDGILRHVSFEGLREDKPAREVVRDPPG